jgi:16S rRNA processing protein RimM
MQSLRVRIAKLSSKSSKRNKTSGEARLVTLGRLGKTHGVGGELRFFPYAFPCPTLQPGLTVSLWGDDGQAGLLTVESVRAQAPFLLIRFQEVTSLDQAQKLRNAEILVEEQRLPPTGEGEFYYYQVIGLSVFTTTGESIGRITQAFFSGGHDVWVVRQGEKEHMIPVTEEIVCSIDIPGGCVVIKPMEGLLDE